VRRRQIVRQVQTVQYQVRRLVERTVVTVPEREPGAGEAARAVTDQIDDGSKFGGHGGIAGQLTGTSIGDGERYNGWMSLSTSASHRSFVWIILVAALAAGVGLWFGNRQF